MKPEIAEKVIAALTSGEYRQETSRLRNGTDFCCLGVICDLYIKETGQAKWSEDNLNLLDLNRCYLESARLPAQVMKWAGMKSPNGTFVTNETNSLLNLNDTGSSFAEIAQVIKERQEEL